MVRIDFFNQTQGQKPLIMTCIARVLSIDLDKYEYYVLKAIDTDYNKLKRYGLKSEDAIAVFSELELLTFVHYKKIEIDNLTAKSGVIRKRYGTRSINWAYDYGKDIMGLIRRDRIQLQSKERSLVFRYLVDQAKLSGDKIRVLDTACGKKCILVEGMKSRRKQRAVRYREYTLIIPDNVTKLNATKKADDLEFNMGKLNLAGTLSIVGGAGLEDASYMLNQCCNLTHIGLENFYSYGNLVNASHMFNICCEARRITFGMINTKNVESMGSMFFACSRLRELDLSEFDTSGVKTMDHMFECCTGLSELDLTNFQTSQVQNLSGMFALCKGLKKLDLRTWHTGQVKDMSEMFFGCESLEDLRFTFNSSDKGINKKGMFDGCGPNLDVKIKEQDI